MPVLARVAAGLVVAAFALMLGCSSIMERGAKEAVERSTGVKVDDQGNKVTIETSQGTVQAEGSKDELPSDFPTKFPIYEGATVVNGTKASGPRGTIFTVRWDVAADVPSVVAFYKKELPAAGYKISNSFEAGGQTSFMLKDEGLLSIKAEGGKTSIAAVLNAK